MEFSRPEYWSGQPFPSPGDLPNPGVEPRSPSLQVDSLPAELQGKPKNTGVDSLSLLQWIFLTQESNQGLLHCRQILYQLSYQGSPFHWRNKNMRLGALERVRGTIDFTHLSAFPNWNRWVPGENFSACDFSLREKGEHMHELLTYPAMWEVAKLPSSLSPHPEYWVVSYVLEARQEEVGRDRTLRRH